jgi:hypothetical protein
LFVIAIGLIAWSGYRSWQEGPWDLPTGSKRRDLAASMEKQPAPGVKPPVTTDMIVSKNLFDPERGAGATREAEESSRAFQRVRGMILVGTVILGNDRVAILQDGQASPGTPRIPGQPAAVMRLKVGDNLEGFRLAEIADRRVVFSKDAARVEVLLDYFRKVETAPPRVAAPGQLPPGPSVIPGQVPAPPPAVSPVPRVVPNLPRRGRIPVPGSPNSES